jgi:isopenicillin N synthase-like dioxygenase
MSKLAVSPGESGDQRIPVLDIAPFLAGEPGARAALAQQIARTCEDTGFLVLSNHGVPPALIDQTFEQAAVFFALDTEAKLALKVGERNIGFLPTGAQTIRTSKINNNTKPNLNESFYVTRERAPDHPDILANKAGLNRWPSGIPEFRTAMLAYFTTMEALAKRMLPAFATALGLPPDYFAPDFTNPSSTLRLIRYQPQVEAEENRFGFAPHIDTNFITFLAQSKLPGLEVLTRDKTWIRPPAIPGTFVVNTAEMLGVYSNDRFKPTPHRVLNNNDAMRYAIPFFLGPDRDAIIDCVPTCVGPDNPARYPAISYADHNRKLDITNFPHRQDAAAS